MTEISEEELQATYAWIDEIPLSRQKKSIARDFSDGGTVCERSGLEAVRMLRSQKTIKLKQIAINNARMSFKAT